MIANNKFKSLPKSFWADVRAISQENGYTVRGKGTIKVPTIEEIISVYKKLSLNTDNIILNGTPTQHSVDLIEYFRYRADILYSDVRPKLMNANQAQMYYEDLVKKHNPKCLIPENKQSGDKKKIAYLTAIVNILIEANIANLPCDYDPRKLATITKDGRPIRTLARRVDGAFPSTVNPIALWEIKEYYYTTTFGSRVADGVYETLLDGMELEELHEHEKIKVLHYLIIDAYNTWWNDGKSYLCRMIDMLNMGYVDEILFGYEVIERLPIIVKEWVALLKYR
jgi:hypothetical protein